MKVGFITLGCDKNTVDTERYLAELADYGGEYTPKLDEADVIIVNTCGFIDAAKKESIDAMLEAARFKSDGVCQAVVGMGCMIERHKPELIEALPEVDVFLGSSESARLAQELAAADTIRSRKFMSSSRFPLGNNAEANVRRHFPPACSTGARRTVSPSRPHTA